MMHWTRQLPLSYTIKCRRILFQSIKLRSIYQKTGCFYAHSMPRLPAVQICIKPACLYRDLVSTVAIRLHPIVAKCLVADTSLTTVGYVVSIQKCYHNSTTVSISILTVPQRSPRLLVRWNILRYCKCEAARSTPTTAENAKTRWRTTMIILHQNDYYQSERDKHETLTTSWPNNDAQSKNYLDLNQT